MLARDLGDRPRARARSRTPPVGLLGVFRMSSFVLGVTSFSRMAGSNEKSFSSRIGHGHRLRAREPDHRLVDREARVRVDDLVAFLHEREQEVEHDRLRARADDAPPRATAGSRACGASRPRWPPGGPAGPRRDRSASSPCSGPRPRPGRCWPGCRSRARRSRGGRPSCPAASSARARARTSNADSVPRRPMRSA